MRNKALDDVAAERERQISREGWSEAHDDTHVNGELAKAAAIYAIPYREAVASGVLVWLWPWSMDWWKPTPSDRRRELVKAAALLVAEIERHDRLEANDAQK